MEYFMDALSDMQTLVGRARRKQYWMFVLFYFIFFNCRYDC